MVRYLNRVDCYSCGKSMEFSKSQETTVYYAYRNGKIRWYCTKCKNRLKRFGSIKLEAIE
jgi:hypothetical protein